MTKRTTGFVLGRWSVRPFRIGNTKQLGWDIYPKGERSHWSVKAQLYPASDGKCYTIHMSHQRIDARPSFDEALDLVIERLEPAPKSLDDYNIKVIT